MATRNVSAQYVLNKIATDARYRRAFLKFAEVANDVVDKEPAKAGGKPMERPGFFSRMGTGISDFYNNNKTNLGSLGLGLAAGAGTYGLSGLIPGVKKQQALRLLLGLMAGAGTAAYGNEIQRGIMDRYNRYTGKYKGEDASPVPGNAAGSGQ